MRRSARASHLVTAVVLAAGLTGCGGGDRATSGSAHLPTALPSATPSTPVDVRQFIRHWAAATVRMETTGKTKEYLALTRQCDVCRALAQSIAHRYAVGGYIRWDGLRIRSIEIPPNSGGVVLYTVHAYSAPLIFRDSASSRERRAPGGPSTYLVGVESTPKSFSVTSVTSS